jgi:hypothetical protein
VIRLTSKHLNLYTAFNKSISYTVVMNYIRHVILNVYSGQLKKEVTVPGAVAWVGKIKTAFFTNSRPQLKIYVSFLYFPT